MSEYNPDLNVSTTHAGVTPAHAGVTPAHAGVTPAYAGVTPIDMAPDLEEDGGKACLTVLRVGDGILYRHSNSWAAAGYYQSEEIISGFDREKVKARLWAFGRILERRSDSAVPIDEANVTPCGVTVPGLGIWSLLRNSGAAIRALEASVRDADVIWAMLPSMLGLMVIAINRGRKPCVAQLVGDPRGAIGTLSAKLRTRLLAAVAAWLVQRAIAKTDGAIFVSEALRTLYMDKPGLPAIVAGESRIRESQLIDPATMAAVHQALENASPSLIYLGRLSPEKGVPILLRALALVPDVTLAIVGGGLQESELRSIVNDLGLAKRVSFLGAFHWGNDLLQVLRRYHALVLPSFTEGLGIVLIEAMSQGVPVIASSVGGVGDLVHDGHSGLLVPAGDPERLAAAITRLLSDAPLRWKLAERGLHVAALNTSERQYAKSTGFILETITRRKSI